MSLDITLTRKKWTSYDAGKSWEESIDYCYDANITHNLNKMAGAAGIYKHLWRPEEIGITKAVELIVPLCDALGRLLDPNNKEFFEQFNPKNGWGNYDGFVEFVSGYLDACRKYPEAEINVSR